MPAPPERISCLMVTRPCPERFELLRRSVSCFLSQTYPERELVVVLDEEPREWFEKFTQFLTSLPGRVLVVPSPGTKTLGALRNLSVQAASGPIVCQWDDDDLCHPERLATQAAVLQGERAAGVVFEDVLQLYLATRQLYWLRFRATPLGCFPGSLMFRRRAVPAYPEEGPKSRQHEDSDFLVTFRAKEKVVPMPDLPYLYVYVYHGSNTFAHEHHAEITRRLAVTRGFWLRRLRRPSLREELARLDLGEQEIEVLGTNGPAFRIPGRGQPARPSA